MRAPAQATIRRACTRPYRSTRSSPQVSIELPQVVVRMWMSCTQSWREQWGQAVLMARPGDSCHLPQW
ncbi:MAG: hypothetical protein R3B49_02310 [Phycisphaerales bacterium]